MCEVFSILIVIIIIIIVKLQKLTDKDIPVRTGFDIKGVCCDCQFCLSVLLYQYSMFNIKETKFFVLPLAAKFYWWNVFWFEMWTNKRG